jgi:hypothetical protein
MDFGGVGDAEMMGVLASAASSGHAMRVECHPLCAWAPRAESAAKHLGIPVVVGRASG